MENSDKTGGTTMPPVEVNAMVMPLGMAKIPFGYPQMFGDFLGFAQWAIGSEDVRADFLRATGVELTSIIPKNGLEAMIDKATGNDHKAVFSNFLDWLVVEVWGEA